MKLTQGDNLRHVISTNDENDGDPVGDNTQETRALNHVVKHHYYLQGDHHDKDASSNSKQD